LKKNKLSDTPNIRLDTYAVFALIVLWVLIVSKSYYKIHEIAFSRTLQVILARLFSFQITSAFAAPLMNYILSVVLLSLTGLIAWAIGDIVLKRLGVLVSGLENFVFASAIGFGVIAYFVFAVGIVGGLYRPLFVFFIAAAGIFSGFYLHKTRQSKKNKPENKKERLAVGVVAKYLIYFSLFFLLVLNFMMAFMPEIFYDALVYHIACPDYYITHHKIVPMLYNQFAAFPFLMQMLYLLGLLLTDDAILPRLFHFLFAVLSISAILSFCRKYLNYTVGVMAAVIFYSTPIVASSAWATGIDVAGGFMMFAAVFAAVNYLESAMERKWLILSAVFTGCALSMKYTNIFFVAGIALTIAVFLLKEKWPVKRMITELSVFSGVAFLVFLPWLIKNYCFVKNPFHPLLATFFGSNVYGNMKLNENFIMNSPLKGVLNFLKSPWNLTMTKDIGSEKYIGPVFLLFTPFLFFLKRFKKRTLFLILFSVLSYIFWGLGTSKLRYYIPALGCVSILTAYGVWEVTRQFPAFLKNTMRILFSVVILTNVNSLTGMALQQYPIPGLFFGSVDRGDFLSRNQPAYPNPCYGVMDYANKNLGKDTRILFLGESKLYGMKHDYLAASVWNLSPLVEWTGEVRNEAELYEKFKAEKITHIILNCHEGIRLHYAYFDWNRGNLKLFNEFWKNHIREIYNFGGSYLYEVSESVKIAEVPLNLIEKMDEKKYKNGCLIQIYNENAKWDELIEEYREYARLGYDAYGQISQIYLKNKNDPRSAVEALKEGIKYFPKKAVQYREAIDYIQSRNNNAAGDF